MRIVFSGMILTLFILLNSCSPKAISFYVIDETDLHFESFSFYERNTTQLSDEQVKFDSLLELTISNALISKNYIKEFPSDVYISFNITTGTSVTSQVDRSSYYSRSYNPYYNVSTSQYKEGVILVEISDTNNKLLWQGSKTFKVRKTKGTRNMLLQYTKDIMAGFKSNL